LFQRRLSAVSCRRRHISATFAPRSRRGGLPVWLQEKKVNQAGKALKASTLSRSCDTNSASQTGVKINLGFLIPWPRGVCREA
jgi:hypothetical protein